ncbi:MAG: CBS domain-containing protein [Oligoflexia bacterium]|nr:CBS domain-containing protein [Oligoflexia bacterium]
MPHLTTNYILTEKQYSRQVGESKRHIVSANEFMHDLLVLNRGTALAILKVAIIKTRRKKMSKSIPPLQKFMTVQPHSIGIDQPIQKARDLMTEYKIRHLPVLKGGKIVGIITDRDIRLVMGFEGVDPEEMAVEEAYTPDPYIASPNSRLDEVASLMAEKKYGCALVADNGKLVGIFTEVDALRALSELLHGRLGK